MQAITLKDDRHKADAVRIDLLCFLLVLELQLLIVSVEYIFHLHNLLILLFSLCQKSERCELRNLSCSVWH